MENNITTELKKNLEIVAAVAFIQEAHKGALYGKMPYFLHPVAVASELATLVGDLEAITTPDNVSRGDNYLLGDIMIAALLHDVIEDTDYTHTDLRDVWGDQIADMVLDVTSDKAVPYLDNIKRIVDTDNIGSMLVKLADNRVNRSGDKSAMDPARASKLNTRYDASMVMLTEGLAARGYKVK